MASDPWLRPNGNHGDTAPQQRPDRPKDAAEKTRTAGRQVHRRLLIWAIPVSAEFSRRGYSISKPIAWGQAGRGHRAGMALHGPSTRLARNSPSGSLDGAQYEVVGSKTLRNKVETAGDHDVNARTMGQSGICPPSSIATTWGFFGPFGWLSRGGHRRLAGCRNASLPPHVTTAILFLVVRHNGNRCISRSTAFSSFTTPIPSAPEVFSPFRPRFSLISRAPKIFCQGPLDGGRYIV